MTHEHYRKTGGNLERTLDMSGIHIEYVLPQTPVSDSDDPVWLPKFFSPAETDEKLVESVNRCLELENRKQSDTEADVNEEEEKNGRRSRDTSNTGLSMGSAISCYSAWVTTFERAIVHSLRNYPQYYNDVDEFTSIHQN